jgi:hypothetical protein
MNISRARITAGSLLAVTSIVLAACSPSPKPTPSPTAPVTSQPFQAAPTDTFDPVGTTAAPGYEPLTVPAGIPHGNLTGPIGAHWIDASNKHLGETIITTLSNDSEPTILPVVAISIDSISEPLPAGPERDRIVEQSGADPASSSATADKWVVQRLTVRIREIARYGTGNIRNWALSPSLRFQTTAGYVNAYPGATDSCHADVEPFKEHGWATGQTTQQCYYLSADPTIVDRSVWVMSITVRGFPAAKATYRGLEQPIQIVTDKRPVEERGE